MRDDLISRKTAIEEMLKCGEYYNGNDEAKRGVAQLLNCSIAQCIGVIHELPSAQPEKHTAERTETHACDCISRQAAIDHWRSIIDATDVGDRYDMGFNDGLEFCISDLSTMQSAQPKIEERKEESAQNVSKEDLISRKAAIEATWFEPSYTDPLNVLTEVRDKLKALPSAQSAKHTEERTETHACDSISRRAAIEHLKKTTI